MAAFALAFGLFYAAGGLVGFVLFPASGLLSAVHLVSGLWGLAAWSGATSPLWYARSMALLYGALALGALPTLQAPVAGAHSALWLHAASALVAAGFALRPAAARELPRSERRRSVAERRHAGAPVARERRHNIADRRGARQGTLAAG